MLLGIVIITRLGFPMLLGIVIVIGFGLSLWICDLGIALHKRRDVKCILNS